MDPHIDSELQGVFEGLRALNIVSRGNKLNSLPPDLVKFGSGYRANNIIEVKP
jgi:hypothetical protein